MRHIMIDNENVHLKHVPDLGSEPCVLWLFAGVMQDKLPTELTGTLLELQKDGVHKVHLIQIAQTGDNALDFCLTYQMGRIAKEYGAENVCFCIYSKDKGFDSVINHMLDQQPPHCAYAVRVSDMNLLKLSEAELVAKVPRPSKRPPVPRTGKPPFKPFQPAAAPTPRPKYQRPSPYQISVSVGTSKAWEGLQKHPEACARRMENLVFRLKEYVLKDWLTYPEPQRTQLVEDIVKRMLQQGNIVQDSNSGLLSYRFDYIERVDSVVGKLYELIKRDNPKPPRSREKLLNLLRTLALPAGLTQDDELEKIIQICVWRGLLSLAPDNEIAYRNLNSPQQHTNTKNTNPQQPAREFKPAPAYCPLSPDAYRISQSAQQAVQWLLARTEQTVSRQALTEFIDTLVPENTGAAERGQWTQTVFNRLLAQQSITVDGGLVTVQRALIDGIEQTTDWIIKNILSNPAAPRPRSLSKLFNLCHPVAWKYGLQTQEALNRYLEILAWQGWISVHEEDEIAFTPTVPPQPGKPEPAAADTAAPSEPEHTADNSLTQEAEPATKQETAGTVQEHTAETENESEHQPAVPHTAAATTMDDSTLLLYARTLLQSRMAAADALPATDTELAAYLQNSHEYISAQDAARAIYLLLRHNDILLTDHNGEAFTVRYCRWR